jgi:hypothetical protein
MCTAHDARQNENVLCNQRDLPSPALSAKIIRFRLTQISDLVPPSRSQQGAFRDRHGRRERDAVDAMVLQTNGTEADGEVVWS